MRKVACLLLLMAVSATMGAAFLITRDQSLVTGALSELKLELIPAKGGVVGGPQRYKVTKQTLNYLEKLRKDGKTLTVQNDGTVTVSK